MKNFPTEIGCIFPRLLLDDNNIKRDPFMYYNKIDNNDIKILPIVLPTHNGVGTSGKLFTDGPS